MELLGYRKCTDGDSEPDLPASVKQRDRNGYAGIPESTRRRKSSKEACVNSRPAGKSLEQK